MINLQRLYKSLVVGGALMVGACNSTGKKQACPVEPSPPLKTQPAEKKASVEKGPDCLSICENTDSAAGIFCPDPSQDAAMNCCWLMTTQHPCCQELAKRADK